MKITWHRVDKFSSKAEILQNSSHVMNHHGKNANGDMPTLRSLPPCPPPPDHFAKLYLMRN